MAKNFRLKVKPRKPTRLTVMHVSSSAPHYSNKDTTTKYISFYGSGLSEMLDWAVEAELSPEQVDIGYEHGYYDSVDLYLSGQREESDIEFNIRLQKYEKQLETWTTWALANKNAIEVAEAAKESKTQKAGAKQLKDTRKRLAKLEKQFG